MRLGTMVRLSLPRGSPKRARMARMSDVRNAEPARPESPAAAPAAKIPLTIAIIVVCVAITAALNYDPTRARIFPVVSPGAALIWHGRIWGLLTSAFAHVALWHLLFNMWWARDFGRLLEPTLGLARYAGFIVASAVVSSGWQLLVSGETGIGYSGVVYALFGYVAVRRPSFPAYASFLTTKAMR